MVRIRRRQTRKVKKAGGFLNRLILIIKGAVARCFCSKFFGLRLETINPASLQLEILQSSVISNVEKISDILRRCRDDLGVKITLDDANDDAIVKAVVGLADSFGHVIAEGVETSEQGLTLLERACVNVQGFGLAKPMPADDMPQWLADYQPNLQWMDAT